MVPPGIQRKSTIKWRWRKPEDDSQFCTMWYRSGSRCRRKWWVGQKVLKITVFWETLRDIERVSLKTLRVSNAENSFFSNALYLSYRLYRLFSFSCQTIFQICYKYNSPSVYYSIYPLINYLLIQYSKHTLRFDTLMIHYEACLEIRILDFLESK